MEMAKGDVGREGVRDEPTSALKVILWKDQYFLFLG